MKFLLQSIFFISILKLREVEGIQKEKKDCNGCNEDYTKVTLTKN